MSQAALELLVQLKDEASSGIKGIGSSLSNLGGMAVAGAAVAGVAIGGFLVNAVKEAADAEGKMAQLNAVIKSTGGAAGMTADSVTALSSALQKTTTFSDDTVTAAQSILLTFTGIGKEVFPDVTKTALDMSTALGTDLSGSAMMLGKALNDPTKGMGVLAKSGVTFTESQKETIKAMQEAGDVAGAQKIILAELSKEFGGSAAAAGKTFSGQMEIAKNMLGEFSETIGGKLLPILTPLIGRFIQFATDSLPAVEAGFSAVMTAIQPVIDFIGNLISSIIRFTGQGAAVGGVLGGIQGALTGLLTGLGLSNEGVNAAGAIFTQVFGAIQTAVSGVIAFFVANWPTIQATIATVITTIVTTIIPMLSTAFGVIITVITTVVNAVIANWPLIQSTIQTVIGIIVTTVIPMLTNAFNSIMAIVAVVVAAFVANWPMIQAAITSAITAITTNVLPILMAGLSGMAAIFEQIVTWVIANWPLIQATVTTVIQAISNVIQVALPIILAVFNAVFPVIQAVVQTVIAIISSVITAAMQLITGDTEGALETIRAAWANVWARIQAALAAVVALLKTVVTNGMNAVKSEISRILNEALTFVETLPAKFLAVGGDIVKGLWNGIQGMGAWFKGVFAAWIKNMIPDWASKALNMGSPSKVMADQVGVPIVQGIIAGIQAQGTQLKAAMTQVADTVAGTNMSAGGAQFGMGAPRLSPMDSLGGATGSLVINVYADVASGVDIDELAYAVASRVQARRSR